jgi:hypothetical protein
MIPVQAMLIHTVDVTPFLAPVTFWLALATIVCGTVLAALGYDAVRADPIGAPIGTPACGVADTISSAPTPWGLPMSERARRAA